MLDSLDGLVKYKHVGVFKHVDYDVVNLAVILIQFYLRFILLFL